MATVITAGNATNGLSLSADNTGSFDFKTGSGAGISAMTISSSQVVSIPGSLTVVGTLTATGGVSGSIRSGTAVASTSGTSIDFTSLPTGIKRITVMFSNVSLSLNESYLIQLGTGSTTYTTSGYTATSTLGTAGGNSIYTSTSGFIMGTALAAGFASGQMVLTNITGNSWVSSSVLKRGTDGVLMSSGDVALGAVLTAVRITSNGTSTFDSGTINILFE